MFCDVRVPAIKVSQAEVENLRLDIFIARRVDGFSQLLDKKVDEFGSRALEIFAKRLRGDWGSHDFAQLRGDLVDRCLGVVSPQLEDRGVTVLGGGRLVRFQP